MALNLNFGSAAIPSVIELRQKEDKPTTPKKSTVQISFPLEIHIASPGAFTFAHGRRFISPGESYGRQEFTAGSSAGG